MSERIAPSPSPFAAAADGIRVRVRVSPRAARDRIDGLAAEPDGGTALKVAVTAAPDGGKANAALARLLAREWDIAKSTITLAGGAASRRKTLHVAGEPQALLRALEGWLSRQTARGAS